MSVGKKEENHFFLVCFIPLRQHQLCPSHQPCPLSLMAILPQVWGHPGTGHRPAKPHPAARLAADGFLHSGELFLYFSCNAGSAFGECASPAGSFHFFSSFFPDFIPFVLLFLPQPLLHSYSIFKTLFFSTSWGCQWVCLTFFFQLCFYWFLFHFLCLSISPLFPCLVSPAPLSRKDAFLGLIDGPLEKDYQVEAWLEKQMSGREGEMWERVTFSTSEMQVWLFKHQLLPMTAQERMCGQQRGG